MTRKILCTAFAMLVATASAEELQLNDGRRIVLHEDGTWSYVSSDRLLGTADGREVRLREDGTWEYTGNVAPATSSTAGEITSASLGQMIFSLQELAIETARSTSHKSSRKKTHTVFSVNLVNNGETPGSLALDSLAIGVEDSAGREYPVLQIQPAEVSLEPGEKAVVEVRADGSPHWFTTKAMELRISDGSSDGIVLKGLLRRCQEA